MKKSVVYVRFPKTGLGNMLLVWANAVVFASLNNLSLVTSSWWGLHWGSILRGERKKRWYFNYFNESSFISKLSCAYNLRLFKTVMNPAISTIKEGAGDHNVMYMYNKVITHERIFLELEPYRDFIVKELYALITKEKLKELHQYPVPQLAVHIRRGDFILTGQSTALSFFVKSIEAIRKAAGFNMPVTIFSDAEVKDLQEVFALKAVTMAEKKADVLDILLMSKSKLLVLSQSSSFSYWAAFLSEAIVVMKHDDWQEGIKNAGSGYYEIRFNETDESSTTLLENTLSSILNDEQHKLTSSLNGA